MLDVAEDACGHVLSFADPQTRHALRATCTFVYRLRAVGALRVPVSSEEALELCHRRQQAHTRLRFWGSTARQLTLVVLDPFKSGDVVPLDRVGFFLYDAGRPAGPLPRDRRACR